MILSFHARILLFIILKIENETILKYQFHFFGFWIFVENLNIRLKSRQNKIKIWVFLFFFGNPGLEGFSFFPRLGLFELELV